MKAQQLRSAVLQLAIQGKLVTQEPIDEPASVLLDTIKVLKEQLINDKKIKREKYLPEITDEEKPFDIPNSWEWVVIGNCALMYTGNSISASDKEQKYTNLSEGYYYIGTKDVAIDGVINYANGIKVPYAERKFKIASEYSTLVCIEGGSAGRKVALIDKNICFGNKLCCITPIKINYKYIYYFYKSAFFYKMFTDKVSGIIGGVGVNTFKTLSLPLPPLAEQQRIVSKIEEMMPLIDQYEKLEIELSNLEDDFPRNLKKSILQYAIQGKLVEQNKDDEHAILLFKRIKAEKEQLIKDKKIKKEKHLQEIAGEDKPFDIPSSWEWVRLGEITNILRGSSPRPKGSPLYWSKQRTRYHWITISDITHFTDKSILVDTREFLTESGSNLSTYVNKNEFIIAVSGSTTGKSCVTGIEGYIYDGLAVIRLVNMQLSVTYLSIFMQYFYEKLNSSKIGSAFPNINTNKLKNICFPLPPFAEQQRIVARINCLMVLCDLLGNKKALNTYKLAPKISSIVKLKPQLLQQVKEVDVEFGMVARAESISPETQAKMAERIKLLRMKK